MPTPTINSTFGRDGHINANNAAFGRSDTQLGTAGTTGLADYSGVQNNRTLPGPVMQPTNSAGAITAFNQVLAKYSENFEPFIQKSTLLQPRFWFDRVPRSAYALFSGASKETNIFRGGLAHYAGLAHWGDVRDYSVATGQMNGQPYPNRFPNPVTYGYAWERMSWTGKNMSWASDPIHINMFRFTNDAQTQLAWILQAGVEFGISQLEVWNRDNTIFAAVQSGRCFVMTPGGEDALPENQVTYNPYAYGPSTDGYLHDKPFILFPADVEVDPLNFDVLDFVHDALSIRAPDAGIGSESGKPVFGLPISLRDFEQYVKGNPNELANWREARPLDLITGYGMLLKSYRFFAMVEDTNQLRFNVIKVVTAKQASDAGIATYGDSSSKALYLAEYVPPRIMGRIGANGQGIPTENPAYIKADLALSPLFMNDVFVNQLVPETPNLGSGTSFGATPGLNGKWGWLNIQDKTTNPFNEVGNFYGTYEIFPKPLGHFTDATCFLYRRCTESLRTKCPINIDEGTNDDANIVSTNIAATTATAAKGEAILNKRFEFKLTIPLDVTVGTGVKIAAMGAPEAGDTLVSGFVYGAIADTAHAPTYGVVIRDLNGVTGSGTEGDGANFTQANFPAGGAVTVL